ncbi:hypothetical protein ACJX0J_029174, partial [Zea mays]
IHITIWLLYTTKNKISFELQLRMKLHLIQWGIDVLSLTKCTHPQHNMEDKKREEGNPFLAPQAGIQRDLTPNLEMHKKIGNHHHQHHNKRLVLYHIKNTKCYILSDLFKLDNAH